MTKKPVHQTTQKPPMPFVSVCTPTFNRRPFIPIMFECFRNQKYPKHRLEWIIIDDGTDKIKDLVEAAKIPQIKYFPVDKKMTLGAKRNMMHDKAKGSILVYMDDDDYYPPERISHAVDVLQANPRALCAGSSEIYLYFKHIHKMYQFGPYNPNHATAATFAFRRELLIQSRYDDTACIAEERAFLKDYTVPFVQLDPMKTILVFSHEHNSFDKRELLKSPHPQFVKESPKTVDMFIRTAGEAGIKRFFMEDIDRILENYAPGVPALKPDVLRQMKEIEVQRQKDHEEMMRRQQQQQIPTIMVQEPGKPPMAISIEDAVGIINNMQNQLRQNETRIKELETKNSELEKKLAARPSSPPKTVSFDNNPDTITLAKNKTEKTEVARLKERIQELENQLKKKSKSTFENAIRRDENDSPNNSYKKTEPETRQDPIKLKSKLEPDFVFDIRNEITSKHIIPDIKTKNQSKLEPEFKIKI